MLVALGFKKIAKEKKPSVVKGLTLGAVAGAGATAITYPIDVRVTAKQTGRLAKLQRAAKEHGALKIYYGGIGEKIGKNALGMGITFGLMNLLRNQIS